MVAVNFGVDGLGVITNIGREPDLNAARFFEVGPGRFTQVGRERIEVGLGARWARARISVNGNKWLAGNGIVGSP